MAKGQKIKYRLFFHEKTQKEQTVLINTKYLNNYKNELTISI